jgi:hypothetical protein
MVITASLWQGGRIAFSVNNGTQSYTLLSSTVVADDNWHYIAVTRSATSVTGDISHRDGRSTTWPNDPFIVLGAEKHDYDNTQSPSYSGYLDELRISNIVRYTSSYIPVNRFADDVKWYFYITLMRARGCCLGTLRF